MNQSDIRLVVTDMDGTLLNSKHELGASFFEVFEELKARGIHFVAASGRQYFNLEKTLFAIKDDITFAAENGSFIMQQNEEIHAQPIDHNTVFELVEIARTLPGAHIVLCGKKKAYVENSDPEFLKNLMLYFERFEIVPDLLDVKNDDFLKFTVCDLAGTEVHSYPHFENYSTDFQVKVSGPIWLDISHKLANKGHAIHILQQRFGVTPNQTMVFGDYFNDVEMLQQAYHSYAMENAHPEVKKIARFIAPSNDDNGVVMVLKNMLEKTKETV